MSNTCETCGQHTDYQGHKNYETWAARLWADNDQGSHEYMMDLTRQAMIQKVGEEDHAQYDLEAYLAEMVDLFTGREDITGMASDLLGSAIESIDFRSWAKDLLEEIREEEAA